MIKATVNNLSQTTNIWIWLNAKEVSSSKMNLLLTFHATKDDALEQQEKITNKYLQVVSMIPNEFSIPMPTAFTNLDGLRMSVSKEAISYINNLELINITSLTIEL